MPVSNDNQDFGKDDQKNSDQEKPAAGKSNLTSDDLKGKKVDADVELDSDKPAEQKK